MPEYLFRGEDRAKGASVVEIGLPAFVDISVKITKVDDVIGLERFAQQGHTRFPRGAVAFSVIAVGAGGDQVFPAVGAAPAFRDHVVDGQLFPRTAVKAAVVVAFQDILAGKYDGLVWDACISAQPDDRGVVEVRADGPDFLAGKIVQHFRLLKEKQQHGLSDVTDAQWLIVLIQNEYITVESHGSAE